MAGGCFGQRLPDSSRQLLNRYDLVLANLGLDTLRGKIVAVYTPGHEMRARALDKLLLDCSLFYDRQFAGVAFNPQVCILDSGGWARVVEAIPNSIGIYGMPDAEPAVNKIFIALHELGHIFKTSAPPITPGTRGDSKSWRPPCTRPSSSVC